MAIPRYNELFGDILRVLSDKQEYKTTNLKEIIANQIDLTEEERNERIPSGGETIIKNRIGWAISSLKKAELVESKKWGYVNITEIGLYEFRQNPNLTEDILFKSPAYVEWRGMKPQTKQGSESTPEEEIKKAHEQINQNLSEELLENIYNQNPFFFERLVVDLLLKMGYGEFRPNAGMTTSPTNDGGIDGIINQDVLGLDSIGIQAKRYSKSQKIGRPLLQNFAGALVGKGLTKGIFITTSSFNKSAIEYVENQANLTIILIDGKKLANLMIEYDLGTSTVDTYHIKRIDTDYFNIGE